jgi:hypothetical protein
MITAVAVNKDGAAPMFPSRCTDILLHRADKNACGERI